MFSGRYWCIGFAEVPALFTFIGSSKYTKFVNIKSEIFHFSAYIVPNRIIFNQSGVRIFNFQIIRAGEVWIFF